MSTSTPLRILVADSDSRIRSAVKILFGQEPGPILMREATGLNSLLTEIQSFQPHIVLLDWDLPGRPASAFLFALGSLPCQAKVIVLGRPSGTHVTALAAGACAAIGKDEPPERLLEAVRQLRGQLEEGL
jgi:DNA-binding NarL/FixJ family response regulator